MLEVTPPGKRATQEVVDRALERISSTVARIGCIDFINIPEILEENRGGIPLYKNASTREFGRRLFEMSKKRIIVNKVVVFLGSREKFEAWLDETTRHYGIWDFVFVGGSVSGRKYPGPTVIEANSIASKIPHAHIGNISIPQREGEVERLVSKTKSGCNFFTTQIILDPSPVVSLLENYDKECKRQGMGPSPFFLSFAPASDIDDVEFLEWLDVDVPLAVEKRLVGSARMGEESIKVAGEIFSDILSHVKAKNIGVPISLNIEQVSHHNFELAEEMAIALKGKLAASSQK